MTILTERDWQALNAYHDDEISASERRLFEHRLRAEPALAAELRNLQAQSDRLKALRPATTPAAVPTNGRRRAMIWTGLAALAASAALAVFLGLGNVTAPSAASIHAEFIAASQPASGTTPIVAPGQADSDFPELGVAGLVHVASSSKNGIRAAHYAGPNGCRITVLMSEDPLMAPKGAAIRVAEWDANGRRFMVLSEGMDQHRFALIARYLQERTEGRRDMAADLPGDFLQSRSCA